MSNVQIDKELTAHQSNNNQKLNNKLNFKYQSSKLILLYLCYSFCNPKTILAHQVNINITGFSYHMGNWSYPDAPRGLDKNGNFIFNPGIGFGWDFRSAKRTSGFSPMTQAMYFRDCSDLSVAMVGGGTRYRYHFNNQFSGDINLLAAVIAWERTRIKLETTGGIEKWHIRKYTKFEYYIFPLFLLGVNYHFKNDMTLGTNLTLMPGTTDLDDMYWILFAMVQLSFPIFNHAIH